MKSKDHVRDLLGEMPLKICNTASSFTSIVLYILFYGFDSITFYSFPRLSVRVLSLICSWSRGRE